MSTRLLVRRASKKRARASPQELLASIRRFLDACRMPVVVEPGEKPIPLEQGHYSLEIHGPRCVLHAWGVAGNVVRRILAVERESRGRLDLRVRRFGAGESTLSLVDRSRKGESLDRQAAHVRFREYFRRLLTQQFSAWTISQLSSAADLEHSLSPVYSRGALSAGTETWAVIGAPAEIGRPSCDQILSFGLIWLDFLRQRDRRRLLRGLKLFLPHSRTQTTANRLAFLNRSAFQFELYEFDRHGNVTRIDEQDYGNLSTQLDPCLPGPQLAEPVTSWVEKILEDPDVEAVTRADGVISLQVKGIQFAQAGRGILTYGLEKQTPVVPAELKEVLTLARELAHFRSAHAPDNQNPLYRRHPESWLESQVRRNLNCLDSRLRPDPVYRHVPAIAGSDRGMIDLLACDHAGRLTVLELKAGEDIHLPLQGLDYWMRVKWHLDRREFPARGYFRGIEVSSEPPRLLLVSPAFEFHPTTETILSCFSPQVQVERVGLSADWRRELKVVFRKSGAQRLA